MLERRGNALCIIREKIFSKLDFFFFLSVSNGKHGFNALKFSMGKC